MFLMTNIPENFSLLKIIIYSGSYNLTERQINSLRNLTVEIGLKMVSNSSYFCLIGLLN